MLPVWGSRPAAEIRRADVRELLERIAAERGGVCANRPRALLSKVFAFGIEKERVEANPVYSVKRVYVEAPRERVLTEEELRVLWPAVRSSTAGRRRRVASGAPDGAEAMRWRDLERDSHGWWWNIPAELRSNQGSIITSKRSSWVQDLRRTPLRWAGTSRSEGPQPVCRTRFSAIFPDQLGDRPSGLTSCS